MDELSAFRGAPPELLDREQELLKRADLGLYRGSEPLRSEARAPSPCVRVPEQRRRASTSRLRASIPPSLMTRRAIPHPRLGFFGVVDERMDLELLAAIAAGEARVASRHPRPVREDRSGDASARQQHPLSRDEEVCRAAQRICPVGMLRCCHSRATNRLVSSARPKRLSILRPAARSSRRRSGDVVRPYGEQRIRGDCSDPERIHRGHRARTVSASPRHGASEVDRFLSQMSWDRTWSEMSQLIDGVASRPCRTRRRSSCSRSCSGSNRFNNL